MSRMSRRALLPRELLNRRPREEDLNKVLTGSISNDKSKKAKMDVMQVAMGVSG